MKCEEAKYNTKRIVISGYHVMNEFLFHASANFISQPKRPFFLLVSARFSCFVTLFRVVNIHIIIFAAFCNLFLSFLLSVDLFSYGLD